MRKTLGKSSGLQERRVVNTFEASFVERLMDSQNNSGKVRLHVCHQLEVKPVACKCGFDI